MPIFLGAVAVILIVSALRGTLNSSGSTPGLFQLVEGDFTGQNNFLIWFAAILAIGSLGYIKAIQPIANSFLGLVLLVLFLSHQGFFAQFVSAAESTQNATTGTTPAATVATSIQPIQLQNITGGLQAPSLSLIPFNPLNGG